MKMHGLTNPKKDTVCSHLRKCVKVEKVIELKGGESNKEKRQVMYVKLNINPLKPELNPICYLLTLLGAHYFLHVSRIRVKLLTFRLLMS